MRYLHAVSMGARAGMTDTQKAAYTALVRARRHTDPIMSRIDTETVALCHVWTDTQARGDWPEVARLAARLDGLWAARRYRATEIVMEDAS